MIPDAKTNDSTALAPRNEKPAATATQKTVAIGCVRRALAALREPAA